MIDHCISALRLRRKEEAWREYVADTLYYQGRNRVLMVRYSELFKKMDDRSGDEIAADIIQRAGLVVTE